MRSEGYCSCSFSNFVLLGDFNVNYFNTSSYLYSHLMYCLSPFDLTQVVQSGTHVNASGLTTLIDLIFVSNLSLLDLCSVIPPLGNSDHSGLQLTMRFNSRKKFTEGRRMLWQYDQGDYTRAKHMIDTTNWDAFFTNDINSTLPNYQNHFLSIMEECIPKVTVSSRPCLPWLTKNILQLIRQRNLTYTTWKKGGNPITFTWYKTLRKKVTSILRTAKKRYFSNLNIYLIKNTSGKH